MIEPCNLKTNDSTNMQLEFDMRTVHILEDNENTLQENALFCCQAQAFCAMRITAQFTFFTPANCFLLLYYILCRSYEDKNADISLSLLPPYFQHPWESSVNPTEMPTTSENHKNIGGVNKVN